MTAAYACLHVAGLKHKFKIDPRRITEASLAVATTVFQPYRYLHSCLFRLHGRQNREAISIWIYLTSPIFLPIQMIRSSIVGADSM